MTHILYVALSFILAIQSLPFQTALFHRFLGDRERPEMMRMSSQVDFDSDEEVRARGTSCAFAERTDVVKDLKGLKSCSAALDARRNFKVVRSKSRTSRRVDGTDLLKSFRFYPLRAYAD